MNFEKLTNSKNLVNSQPTLYPVVPLEFIYADSILNERSVLTDLNLRVAGGEIAPLTFAVRAGNDDILNFTIKFDFTIKW